MNYMKILLLTIIFIFLNGCSTTPKVDLPPLTRGLSCNESHPTNVNLRFESISLLTSLQLLAEFSCNEMRYKNVEDKEITTNYSETPWETVVHDICGKNNLKCWTKEGYLYVTRNNEP